ncbi:MAG: SurA N-terminal domain-containing protein [Thiotrichales bacterium]
MLQSIRDKSRGWFAYVVIAFISIPFMFWGIQEYLGGGDKRVAATINDTEISVVEYQRSVQQYTQRLRELFGAQLPAELSNPAVVRDSVLNGMIRDYLKHEYALGHGMRTSDEQLVEEIRVIPMFQDGGRFSPSKYEQVVTQQFRSKAGFEQQLRQDLLNSQLELAIESSSFLTPVDLSELRAFKEQRRVVRYFDIDHSGFSESVRVDDQQIRDYYSRNEAAFVTPDRVKLHFIALDERQLAERVPVDDDALKSFYEEYRERYSEPEARRLSMILLKVPEADLAAEDAVRIKADELFQRLQAGESFDTLAGEASQDSLSASQGGDLGWVGRGEFSSDIETIAFAAEVGTVTRPVLIDGAFRMFKVNEIRLSTPRPFDEVRSDVEREYRQRQVERMWIEQSDRLVTLAYENPTSLEPAAAALDLDIQTSDWITAAQGSGIAVDPKVRAVAFSNEILAQNRNSEVIDLGSGREVVIRIAEHEPSRSRPIEDVKDSIRNILEKQQLRAAAVAAGERALESAREGQALETLAGELNAAISSPGAISRQTTDIPRQILDAAFRMDRPSDGKPVYSGLQLDDGDYVVLELVSVEAGNGDASASLSDAVESAAAAYAQRQIDALLSTLQARAKIEVFDEHLKE